MIEPARALFDRIAAALGVEEGREEAINLIASQNVMSDAARAAAASTLGQRSHVGARHVDVVEQTMLEAARTLYGTGNVEYRLMSGSLANQMAIVGAIPAGATVLVMPRAASGDRSIQANAYLSWRGANVIDMPFDYASYNVDVDGVRSALREHRPAWLIIGGSRPLFPYPIAALRADADAVGCRILYDGAHILGLWAGGEFQNPLAEGADVVTGSTQKTLPGPLGGLLFCKDPEVLRVIARMCDDVLGDYGNARIAALAVTLTEMVAFGREYAMAIVVNARALAEALAAEGFSVAGAGQGFTASHQVLVYPRGVRVADVMPVLDDARILCSLVPLRAEADTVTGLRLGTSSVTRRGMTPVEMKRLAGLIARLLLHGEEPRAIGREVRALRAQFPTVHYAFPV
jgi:glycine hydroxymethyltransferase